METRSIARIEMITSVCVASMQPIKGGCVSNVFTVKLTNGVELVAKVHSIKNPDAITKGFFLGQGRKPRLCIDKHQICIITFV